MLIIPKVEKDGNRMEKFWNEQPGALVSRSGSFNITAPFFFYFLLVPGNNGTLKIRVPFIIFSLLPYWVRLSPLFIFYYR